MWLELESNRRGFEGFRALWSFLRDAFFLSPPSGAVCCCMFCVFGGVSIQIHRQKKSGARFCGLGSNLQPEVSWKSTRKMPPLVPALGPTQNPPELPVKVHIHQSTLHTWTEPPMGQAELPNLGCPSTPEVLFGCLSRYGPPKIEIYRTLASL